MANGQAVSKIIDGVPGEVDLKKSTKFIATIVVAVFIANPRTLASLNAENVKSTPQIL